MNSVLQCLSHTRKLNEYMISNEFAKDSRGQFSTAFADINNALWLKNTPVKPTDFMNFFQKHINLNAKERAWFKLGVQHDAQEFLNFLLDELSADLRKEGSTDFSLAFSNAEYVHFYQCGCVCEFEV
jgi:ubiquitin C-terminal hydrolase